MTAAGCSPRVDANLQVVPDADLSAFNTFGLRARAARLLRVRSVDALRHSVGM